MMIKLGLIGCGAIGSCIAKAILNIPSLCLVCLCDQNKERAKKTASLFPKKPEIVDIPEVVKKADLIIEASSIKVVKEILPLVISEKKDLMVMSVGGLLGEEKLLKRAEDKGIKIYVPSGAIAGIDGLKGALLGNIEKVTLKTRKPPKGLLGAPYIEEKGIDLLNIKDKTRIFKGTAFDAIKGFPANVNVSATLSLAGIGEDKTEVEIIADPKSNKNIHEILIIGDFGRINIRCENLPSKDNPKTSYLASLSAIATLKSIVASLKIGT
ncbi:MAG: aspartate dehydrogenase [bacterium]